MTTNNPLAELLGIPGTSERHHPIVREPEPVSTEWCSERLGTDLIYFLQDLERRFQGSLRDQAKSLRERVSLAGMRERGIRS